MTVWKPLPSRAVGNSRNTCLLSGMRTPIIGSSTTTREPPEGSTRMKTSDFDYDLPEELIAQKPAAERDGCRMLVMDRATGALEDRIFRDIADYLHPGDLLIANETPRHAGASSGVRSGARAERPRCSCCVSMARPWRTEAHSGRCSCAPASASNPVRAQSWTSPTLRAT